MVDRVNGGVMDGSHNWGMDSVVNSVVRDNGNGVSHQGSSMDSVMGNHRGGVDSVMSYRVDWGLVGRFRVCLSLVSHIGNEPILVVSVVGHNLLVVQSLLTIPLSKCLKCAK